MLKSGKDHKDRGISGISELSEPPILAEMRLSVLVIVALLTLTSVMPIQAQQVAPHLGTYQGTLRNASGVLQLGGADATKSVVKLSISGDSLVLEAIDKAGTLRRLATWPMSRVNVAGEVLTATGASTGAIHLRRSLTWKLSGGIRVSAELTTAGASQRDDDFFGGSRVMLTLLKIR